MTRPVFIAYPDMPLSERLQALRTQDVFVGANLLVDRADAARDEAGKEMEQYVMAMLNNMPCNARLALQRAVKHCQTALVLYAAAEKKLGNAQRREVKIR